MQKVGPLGEKKINESVSNLFVHARDSASRVGDNVRACQFRLDELSFASIIFRLEWLVRLDAGRSFFRHSPQIVWERSAGSSRSVD